MSSQAVFLSFEGGRGGCKAARVVTYQRHSKHTAMAPPAVAPALGRRVFVVGVGMTKVMNRGCVEGLLVPNVDGKGLLTGLLTGHSFLAAKLNWCLLTL